MKASKIGVDEKSCLCSVFLGHAGKDAVFLSEIDAAM
jgi:hypothetical protein